MVLTCGSPLLASAASPFKGAWSVQAIASSGNQATRLIDKNQRPIMVVTRDRAAQLLSTFARIQREAGTLAELWLVQLTDDKPNAFATSGDGKQYVMISLPMLDLLGDDMDAYAFLFGHELAHLVKQHGSQSQARSGFLQGLSLIASIVISAKTGINLGGLTDLGANLIDRTYSRDQEREADYLGVIYMMASGFDPQGAITLQHKSLAAGSFTLPFLSSHPSGQERIANIQQFILDSGSTTSITSKTLATSRAHEPPATVALAKPTPAMPQAIGLDRVFEAVDKIKNEYVDVVDDEKLVSGCLVGLRQRLGENPNYPPLVGIASPGASVASKQIEGMFASLKIGAESFGDKELADACLRGIIGRLDPIADFLEPDEYILRNAPASRSNPIAGIGIEFEIEEGLPVIVSPLDDGPAHKAGLRSGDIMLKIDDVTTEGLSLKEIATRLRGVAGSKMRLTILREGESIPLEMVVTRDVVRIETVKWKTVAPGYVYIRISQFAEITLEGLAQALTRSYAENQGEIRGIILDLRNNSGGLLYMAVGVAAAFLPADVLISETRGRTMNSSLRLYARAEHYNRPGRPDPLSALPRGVKTVPMAVLVNHGSASGAEIVVAALQDHKRATVFGVQTRAIGLITTIFPMKDKSALKLTTSRNIRPSGAPIGGLGVTPDMFVAETSTRTGKLGVASRGTPSDPVFAYALNFLGGRARQD